MSDASAESQQCDVVVGALGRSMINAACNERIDAELQVGTRMKRRGQPPNAVVDHFPDHRAIGLPSYLSLMLKRSMTYSTGTSSGRFDFSAFSTPANPDHPISSWSVYASTEVSRSMPLVRAKSRSVVRLFAEGQAA